MPGMTSFVVKVYVTNAGALPELSGRLGDMSPAFESIVRQWALENPQKFQAAKGAETSGAEIDPEVFWEPLTPETIKKKHPDGAPKRKVSRGGVEYPDWIMVDTGELMRAMSDPELLHRAVTAQDAVFGTPVDPDDAMKVFGNWIRRQVVFLSGADQNMIRQVIGDYLNMGANFEQIRMAKGVAALQRRQEVVSMGAEYDVRSGPDDNVQ